MSLKHYLDENVPEFKEDRLDNTKEAYEHEYDAAFQYFKENDLTEEDQTELVERGFDLNQASVWEKVLGSDETFQTLQDVKKWRYTVLNPLKECSEGIERHCAEHTEYAKLGCYFTPDVAELADTYGIEKVRMVVANHVRIHTGPKNGRTHDGRYDEAVRKWAWTVPQIPKSPHSEEDRPYYMIGLGNLHSTLCDSLARKVMEYEKAQELKAPDKKPKRKGNTR